MARIAVVVLLVLVAAIAAAWRFELLPNPFARDPGPPPVPAVLVALAEGDDEALRAALAAGADLGVLDAEGRPPLHVAAAAGRVGALEALLAAGADVHWAAADGSTALHLALRNAPDPRAPLLLLNAGADPTVRDAAGQGVIEHANANGAVRNSGLYPRLRELADGPFQRGWPSAYVLPVAGSTISSRAAHWPNAPRAYRNGTHEGFDFYDRAVSGTAQIAYGTPIVAVADGTVIRADHAYEELSIEAYEGIIDEARRVLSTPPDVLDQLRGRQVWIEHVGGFTSRYAHLSEVPADLQVGDRVAQGQVVGLTGNSGTIEAAEGTRDDPHPHVEVWRGSEYLGQGLEPAEIFVLAGQLFGLGALPPAWGP
jgi:murein DD-endopeptidase MepM/ murein hydrolase activator NlpD